MTQGQSDRFVVVSTDCHAGASVMAYRDYLDKRWHEEFDAWAPTFFDPWSELEWGIEDLEEKDIKIGVASFSSEINWDSAHRQKVLESDGIVAEVIFPNTAPPFFPSGVLTVAIPHTRPEYERRMAGLRAHNTWLSEFCAELPGRRVGVAQVFLNDVDDTVAEIRRIHALGLNSIFLPGDTTGGLVPLYHPRLDPVWAVCEELGVIIHKHGLFAGDAVTKEGGAAGAAVGIIENKFWSRRSIAHLLLAGVFERFPELTFVQTEASADWIPDYLATYDALYDGAQVPGSVFSFFAGAAVEKLPKRPSEYFYSNCWIAASFMTPAEGADRYRIGLDRLMWGSDLPHTEGTYPYTMEALRATFAQVPTEEARMILGETAAKVYGLDMAKLQKIADEIGPLVNEVHEPLALHEWPKSPEQTTCPVFANPPKQPAMQMTKRA